MVKLRKRGKSQEAEAPEKEVSEINKARDQKPVDVLLKPWKGKKRQRA